MKGLVSLLSRKDLCSIDFILQKSANKIKSSQ